MTLNTSLFSDDFTNRLLETLSIDAEFSELVEYELVHGDNAHASRADFSIPTGTARALTYIDPPYNTGDGDFAYKDSYRHSSWLAMMAERLALGRELERPTGVVAISIDDHEQHRLAELLTEVYGDNELAKLVWDRNRKNDAKYFSVGHEYMLVSARSQSALKDQGVRFRRPKEGIDEAKKLFAELVDEHGEDWSAIRAGWLASSTIPVSDPRRRLMRYTKVGPRGPYRDDGDASWPGGGGPRYEVLHPATQKPSKIPSRGWVYPTPERFWEVYQEGGILFKTDETTVPSVNRFVFDSDEQVMPSVFYSYAQIASQEFNAIFGYRAFDNPKNWRDLARLVRYLSAGDLVVDYFAGSGSTAHATLAVHPRIRRALGTLCWSRSATTSTRFS